MRAIETEQLLSEDFLIDLYYTCFTNEYILSVICDHMQPRFLPNRDFQTINRVFKSYFEQYKKTPTVGIVKQNIPRSKRAALDLVEEIFSGGNELTIDEALDQLERFIRQVKFQEALQKSIDLMVKGSSEQAQAEMLKFDDWSKNFGLISTEFVDVVAKFQSNFFSNRQKHNAANKMRPVTRFYIDELDARNAGRNLRGQLTCILASSGVGKTHMARWIGKCACQEDGLDVLHIQLEGKESEAVDAYSASFAKCSTFLYENGLIENAKLDEIVASLQSIQGSLNVKAFSKFNDCVTTTRIHNIIQDYKKSKGHAPDVVIIDSMDLVEDPTSGFNSDKNERHKRIKVCRDLKDIADDENVWMVVTYQSTIEDREKLNDENFVLTEYNCAEAKGLVRPVTHMITLNQSDREAHENAMRLHFAKSRFFPKGKPMKIATNYDEEQFYDRNRTLNMAKFN